MSRFFIHHPVFAWVIAILITLGGVLAISGLDVESYPNIAPPQVTVSAIYPGASAATTEGAVTQLIEPQLPGNDNLDYFSHSSISTRRPSPQPPLNTSTDPGLAPDSGRTKRSQERRAGKKQNRK